MSEIPPHWSWVKLGDVIDKISTTGIKLKQKEYLQEGDFPVVDQGQELIGGFSNDKNLVVDCELPVIIFGDHTKVKKFIDFKFVAGADGAKVLKPHKVWDPKLFYYFLYCIKFPDKGYARHFQFVEKADIPLPPLPEQKKIVEKIEELFSGLDNGIASLKKSKEQIKLYRQSVLASAFNGQLLNNKGYESSTIKEELELIDGDRGPNYPKRNDYKEKGYCLFLSTKNVRPTGFLFEDLVFISKEKHNQLRKGTLSRGDLVLTTRGTVGNIAYYDESVPFDVIRINSGMLILRIRNDNYFPKFIIYYVQSPQFIIQIKQKKTGTAQPQLPANILKSFIIPKPSIVQQTQIVEEIEKRFSEADNLEKAIDESLKKSEALRQSILKQAFKGKLV